MVFRTRFSNWAHETQACKHLRVKLQLERSILDQDAEGRLALVLSGSALQHSSKAILAAA